VQVLPQLIPAGEEVTVPLPVPARVTPSENPEAVLNVAVTARAAVIDTVQVLVPVQAPLQPANVEPLAAAAVSVTDVPLAMFALQVLPQLMPPVFEVTVPEPLPALVTVSANVAVLLLNVALTERAALIVTVQVVAVPLHEPPQPPNVEPLAAAAVSVTEVPLLKFALQVLPQLMPVGDDVTVPLPEPLLVSVSANELVVPPTPRMMAFKPLVSVTAPVLRLNIPMTSPLEPSCTPLSQ